MFWVISVYFNIRNTLPKSGTFLLGHPVYRLCSTSRMSTIYLDSAIHLDCLRYISTICDTPRLLYISILCSTSRMSAIYLDSLRYNSTVCLLSKAPFCGAHKELIPLKKVLFLIVCYGLFSGVKGETGVPVRGH